MGQADRIQGAQGMARGKSRPVDRLGPELLPHPGERARLLREIGDHKFTEFAEIPLFWLFAEAAVNPKYIAEYVFPGVITGSFTHLEYVKPAP